MSFLSPIYSRVIQCSEEAKFPIVALLITKAAKTQQRRQSSLSLCLNALFSASLFTASLFSVSTNANTSAQALDNEL
ncbi:hypothetical protein, partial [Shewanella sp.]|uniref:hypothetical protein n=1 Tax=Shewanella sp. TaxID=50422 RepID=UPI000E8BFD06